MFHNPVQRPENRVISLPYSRYLEPRYPLSDSYRWQLCQYFCIMLRHHYTTVQLSIIQFWIMASGCELRDSTAGESVLRNGHDISLWH
jgi:hypothetical protein